MDDFDIEVGPIDDSTGDEPTYSAQSAHRDSPFAARLSGRARALRAGSIVGMLVLTLMALVAATPWALSAVTGFVLGPTPTATPSLGGGQDRFAFEDQVPWGTLSIDGHLQPRIAAVQLGTATAPPHLPTFVLARGRHTLEYRAAPFPLVRCTVSVPAASGDTCPTALTSADDLASYGDPTRLLDLRGTVDHLPAQEVAQLASATQRTLDNTAGEAQGTLSPGDHYLLDDHGRVAIAGQTLNAVPNYSLQPSDSTGSDSTCAELCSTVSPWAQSSADEWLVFGKVSVTWRYSDTSGSVVLAKGPAAPLGADQIVSVQLGVRRVDSQWQVRLVPPIWSSAKVRDPLICRVGTSFLDSLRFNLTQATVRPSSQSYQWSASPTLPVLGCIFGGVEADRQGRPAGAVAIVLYRYGTLLAVNDVAESVFPHIPLASAHERAMALAVWQSTASGASPVG
ncbi:MAG TPA: hypothetical protein VGK33_06795 [Chloroflexota bacterium]